MVHIPKPFKRPSIEIGAPGRIWQEVYPLQLAVGDIVPDHGKVDGIKVSSGEGVVLKPYILVTTSFLSGEVYTWKETDRIKAFTTGDSPWPDTEEYLRGHRE